jgi:hypothetical protein
MGEGMEQTVTQKMVMYQEDNQEQKSTAGTQAPKGQ